jgi:branched-chain amino acid transport system permease protein
MDMAKQTRFNWKQTIQLGLLAGVIALSLSAIGVVGTFAETDIIGGVFSVGHVFLFGATVGCAFIASQRNPDGGVIVTLLRGLALGLLSGLFTILLVVVGGVVDAEGEIVFRQFLPNVSHALMEVLTFGQGQAAGALLVAGIASAAGLFGAGLYLLPDRVRRPLFAGLTVVLLVGLLSQTIILAWGNEGLGLRIRRVVFAAQRGLSILGASVVFLLTAGLSALWGAYGEQLKERVNSLPTVQRQVLRWGGIGLGALFLLFLPMILRTYLTEVMVNVGLYILMGLGLNIVVGFAGLLDLGYVAFYAIGAYTMGVLTSNSELGISTMGFWLALPIAIGAAVLMGIILGIPVLRMRGDYLAIITMGFGEIIRLLAGSDWLAPAIGGAQGILQIPKIPMIGLPDGLVKPEHLYYMILIGCVIAFFISWRLRDARLGRQWMAIREDEDVAEAMGINLTKTKLLAFAIGAAFSGFGGAIQATHLSSIFPYTFRMEVSINVLSLIIVGGMGSLPGVVVGALILVGLPELLREFAEYRMLMYGALLIVMMLVRPEGFWPSEVIRRELHADEEPAPTGGGSRTEPA